MLAVQKKLTVACEAVADVDHHSCHGSRKSIDQEGDWRMDHVASVASDVGQGNSLESDCGDRCGVDPEAAAGNVRPRFFALSQEQKHEVDETWHLA